MTALALSWRAWRTARRNHRALPALLAPYRAV